jgi:Flp pilus assembly protein protease CpaA
MWRSVVLDQSLLLRGGVVAILLSGALADLRTRRIPNILTLGGALLGFVANLAFSHEHGAISSLEGWGLGVLLLAVPFLAGQLGAGDLKLLGAVGAWAGPEVALATAIGSALVAGVIVLATLVVRGQVIETIAPAVSWARYSIALIIPPASTLLLASTGATIVESTGPPRRRASPIPYAPALAAGGILALLLI